MRFEFKVIEVKYQVKSIEIVLYRSNNLIVSFIN
jgi:hypothetical protein